MGNLLRISSVLLLLFSSLLSHGQMETGELRIRVSDASGLGVRSTILLTSTANRIKSQFTTDAAGRLDVPHLPLGIYNLRIESSGFAPLVNSVEVRSSLPNEIRVALKVASQSSIVNVTDEDTLVEPNMSGTVQRIGPEDISQREISLPGRALQDLVNAEPGWLYEGDAVLHPRGSEYQTQFVVDGIPLTENRSPGLGPEIAADDVQSMSVYTAGFPAEFGRKLGGVIEINTVRDTRAGFHGKVQLSGGSFNTRNAYAQLQYGWGENTLTASADGGATDWYLNPPVPQNNTNSGTLGDFALQYERDFTPNDRARLTVRHDQSRFQVPNEQIQQTAGQRQDRGNNETLGMLSYQHIFNPKLLGDFRFMARRVDSTLTSNAASTPVMAAQDRGFDEQYAKGTLSYHHGRHDWKGGFEADFASLNERFSYLLTDSSQFDPGTPASFQFAGETPDHEQAFFIQDTIRLGAWTASLGLRWDHYHLLVRQSAVSPRVAISRYMERWKVVLHASYDRIFQTPAEENLLLSSSSQVVSLNPQVLRVPVRPSLGNDYEIGATKDFAGRMRADINYYRRTATNFADDDQLLNTSVSFPIAFRRASIHGAEAKLDLPEWKRLSGTVSYSYMVGFAYLPVTGGLFLGSDAADMLRDHGGKFPISQDQRNTVRAKFGYRWTSRLWTAVGAQYGSGLPVEFDGTYADAVAQYGHAIVDRVDFARGRVRPNLSVDLSASADLLRHDDGKLLQLQAELENLNNRVNLINFVGLFSGNTLEPPRSYRARLLFSF